MSFSGFVFENRRFLAFGLLLTAFSSFGQTYYIALFGAEIRAEFGLSHGDFGSVYALATLSSGLCLIWLGRVIDTVDLRIYSVVVAAGLIAACLFMATVGSVLMLGLAIFTLRLSGQGLMSHTAITSMARYFDDQRGKAVSVASIGHALGEAAFPSMAVALIAVLGWRDAWTAVGAALALVLVPLVLWVLKGHGDRHRRYLARLASGAMRAGVRQWSRRDVLRDTRFYLALPSVLAPSYIITGIFFHQVHLVAGKGWTMTWFAGAFVAYAAATMMASLLAGALIDRAGSLRLLPVYLLPLALGLALLAAFDHPYVALVFMVLAGFSTGASFTIVGAVWAEVYGVAHLGAIRALTAALGVFASALAPAVMGWLIDAGTGMDAIALMAVAQCLMSAALVTVAYRGPRRPARPAA